MAKKSIKEEKLIKKEASVEIVEAPKSKKYIVRDDLGFKKRNYHNGVKIITLVAGKEVDEVTYSQFSAYCKEVFFAK